MTSLTLHRPRPWTTPRLTDDAEPSHTAVIVMKSIDGLGLLLRPVLVTLAVTVAAALWPAHAHADDGPGTTLNGLGIGNNGAISTSLASIGQSICPMLVKPGAEMATMASQLSGKSALPPSIVGFVATIAIQTQCPGVMTSLANGNMPFGLQMPGSDAASSALPGILGLNSGSALPPGLLGASPAPAAPFQLPGLTAPGLAAPGLGAPGLTVPGG